MKRVLALLALGALAPMIQGVAGSFLAPHYCPDLGLLLVVGVGLGWRGVAGGAALSATLGLIADLLSGSLLGHYVLLRLLAFAATRVCSRRLNLRGAIPRVIFAVGITVASGLCGALLGAFFAAGPQLGPDPALLRDLTAHALITGAFAPAVIRVAEGVSSWLGEAEGGRSILTLPPRGRAS